MSSDFQVRYFDLDAIHVDLALLSVEEAARVARKATPVLRQRQAGSFIAVRQTLAEVIGVLPGSLALRIAECGKPFIEGHALHFNTSHSGGAGMLAWSIYEIGSDIEALIARPNDALAAEILSSDELARWPAVDEALRQSWLTRAWTRKESALKAIGSGLRISPRKIAVGGGDSEGAAWGLTHAGHRWRGVDLFENVPEGYLADVCVQAVHE